MLSDCFSYWSTTAIGRELVVTNGCFGDVEPKESQSERRAALERPEGLQWVGSGSSRRALELALSSIKLTFTRQGFFGAAADDFRRCPSTGHLGGDVESETLEPLIRNTQASGSRPEFCVQVISVDGLDLAVLRDGKQSPSQQLIKLRLERPLL